MPKVDNKRLLKLIHSGNLEAVVKHHSEHPEMHWQYINYEATGDTIIHVASRLGRVDIVNYLLENYQPKSVDCRNNDHKTALHEAAQFSQLTVARILLDNGANVDALKKADWTPLMLACTKNCVETVKLLLERGANVNYCNKDGWTAIHFTAREGNLEILKLLIEKGANLLEKSKNGRSVLHISILHGNIEIFKELMKNGLDVDGRDRCGNTPLHEATLSSDLANFNVVLETGADASLRNRNGYTILHLAASVGANAIIHDIIEKGLVSINDQASDGVTALHCCARKNLLSSYRLLTDLGASDEIMDVHNRTPNNYLNIM